jgi:phage gp37-like protein
MSILAVEDALIAECTTALGTKVRGVQSLPGDWDDDMLRRFLRLVPGVYVSFGGGGVPRQGATGLELDSRWIVYVGTGHASGETARRRGDALQAGAYELLEVLLPRLHGLLVPNVGSVRVTDVSNLWTGSIDRQGLAVYAIALTLPMALDIVAGDDVLAPFETFAALYDVPPHDIFAEHRKWLDGVATTTAPDAADTVTLPQT